MSFTDIASKNGHIIHFRSGVFSGETLTADVKGASAVLFVLTEKSDFSLVSHILSSGANYDYLEICCVGPNAEEMHDSIDDEIVASDTTGIVTTWFKDGEEACEYFVYALGAIYPDIIVLVGASADISQLIRQTKTGAEQNTNEHTQGCKPRDG